MFHLSSKSSSGCPCNSRRHRKEIRKAPNIYTISLPETNIAKMGLFMGYVSFGEGYQFAVYGNI